MFMPSRIPLEELARLPSFFAPTPSWAGDRVAFYWDRTGRLELFTADLNTGAVTQISHGEVPRAVRAGFVWDRTDRQIVFAKDRDGDEQHDLFAIDVASRAVTRLTDNPHCQEVPVQFSPDNQWLTVQTNRVGQMNLWKTRPDGSEYTQLTAYTSPVGGGFWSPDGQWLAYGTNETSVLKNTDVYVMRADGSAQRKVYSAAVGSQDWVADWSPDGLSLAITSDVGGLHRPGILDWQSGAVRWLGEDGADETAVRFSADGRWLACIRNHEAQIRPVLYDVQTGARRDLKLPAGIAVGSHFVLGNRALLTMFMSDTTRPSLVLYDLADDSFRAVVAAEYGTIDPSVFVEAAHIWYPSFDGTQIPAILYRPRDLASGERRPAIVCVHGGPTAQWLRGFDVYAQFLVDAGYVVIEPNPRGSTGYGTKFRDMAIKDWGGADLEDVAHAAMHLKSLPYVDPARIGVFGGSYGGYMTFMAVTKKPELWRAGAAWVGITDLHRLYAGSMEHFKYYLRQQMGDPDKDADLWRDRSAINFVENMRARLLIVHGVNDPRCPIEQARVFRDRLLELDRTEGKDFEYVELAEEGHGSSDIQQKIRAYQLLVDFMQRNL
ncbi:MAG: prolyl oligopeptidase family serine peptidase [Chloroflexi bacterium]|nr:prolyl oligopeptidase family serine peptidase [Chloroflexota bacterium]